MILIAMTRGFFSRINNVMIRKMIMVYLNVFTFLNEDMEFDFFIKVKRTCYDEFYPFKIFIDMV